MPYTDNPQSVLGQIRLDQKPSSIYILMGEEEYFIDKIEKKIVSTYMPDEDERAFNYTLLYGSSCGIDDIIASCRRYPMGGDRTIVVVREAQALVGGGNSAEGGSQPLSGLVQLLKHPNPYNILVVCIKGGKRLNRKWTFVKELERGAMIVDSKEIRDYKIEPYIQPIAGEYGLTLSFEAIQQVAGWIGTDLVRLDSEMEKLSIALPAESRAMVTPQMILQYTSASKEFSVFDLRRAIAYRQVGEAHKIAKELSRDSGRTPIQMIIPQIFSFFSNLLLACYASNPKDQRSVMSELGITNPFFVREYMSGLNNYSAVRILDIIKYLRYSDARSKGMYSDEGESEEILTDLVLFILS